MSESHIVGCILGTAIGDSIGLPYEGVSRRRSPRLLGPADRQRFFFRRGMVSDDTEHTCMVAQALISSRLDIDQFQTDFARRLRWWFALLPAGVGLATVRSCLKLWIGVSPNSSGVFSAGNGPSMRAAVFGAVFDDTSTMVKYVRSSTRITHSDPKAEYGAIAVAFAALFGRQNSEVNPKQYLTELGKLLPSNAEELIQLLSEVVQSVGANESTLDFAAGIELGAGVSGYTYHTVPIAIHSWLSHPHDFEAAVKSVVACGGDADTTAAIVGGIVGAAVGDSGLPEDWLKNLREWPRSVEWMRRLSRQLHQAIAGESPGKPVSVNFVAVLVRNILFLIIVLCHGFRRMLPPY